MRCDSVSPVYCTTIRTFQSGILDYLLISVDGTHECMWGYVLMCRLLAGSWALWVINLCFSWSSCRILSTLYTGSVYIWNYQNQVHVWTRVVPLSLRILISHWMTGTQDISSLESSLLGRFWSRRTSVGHVPYIQHKSQHVCLLLLSLNSYTLCKLVLRFTELCYNISSTA